MTLPQSEEARSSETRSNEPKAAPVTGMMGRRERMLLAGVAAALGVLLFWLRGGLQPQAPLEAMARRSPELAVALANGRPSLVEFYADWCRVCQAMAPAIERIERDQRGRLNVVLLNVDNPRWLPEIRRYDVNGIPHLELFDRRGQAVGRSLGERSLGELQAIASALINDEPLPELAGVRGLSALAPETPAAAPVGPRSHG